VTVCPTDLQVCGNGQSFARSPQLKCNFPACPAGTAVTSPNNPCVTRFPTSMTHRCPNGLTVTRSGLTCSYPLCSTAGDDDLDNEPRTSELSRRTGAAPSSSKPSSCGSANDGTCSSTGCPSSTTCCKGICYSNKDDSSKFPVVWIVVIAAVVLFGIIGAVAICGKSGSSSSGPMGHHAGGMTWHSNPVNL
jgi:hypothetical protein